MQRECQGKLMQEEKEREEKEQREMQQRDDQGEGAARDVFLRCSGAEFELVRKEQQERQQRQEQEQREKQQRRKETLVWEGKLVSAVEACDVAAVERLVAAGASPDAIDSYGRRAAAGARGG